MRAMRLVTVFLGLMLSLCQVSYAQKEAVVEIWVVKETGHSLGTGFFFGGSNTVLTCYHVIRGAKEIRVVHRPDRAKPPNNYTDVSVLRYAPDHDLATLQVRDAPSGTPYIRATAKIPSWKEGQEMAVYGHPHGTAYLRLPAPVLHDGYIKSGDVTARGLKSIFRIEDVNVVMLGATIYGGMSGGPVVFERGCVGVLSGCKHEGGTIAWAIPCLYAEPQRMNLVGKAPRDIVNWPTLTLMVPDRATLIHSTQIERSTQDLLDEYFAELGKLSSLNDVADAQASKAWASVAAVRLMMQGALSKGSRRKELSSNPVYKSATDEMGRQLKSLLETRILFSDSSRTLSAHRNRLRSAVGTMSRRLPNTQKNDELRKEYRRLGDALESELAELAQANSTKEYARTAQDVVRSMAKSPTDWQEMNGFLKTIEAHLLTTLDPRSRRDCTEVIRVYRDLGYVWERIFVEEYDARDVDWVFICEKGYRMVIPAGWQIDTWPDTPDSNPIDRDIRKIGLEPCLYVTNRVGDDLRDAVYAAICTFSDKWESSPIDNKLEHFRMLVSNVGDRAVEIHTEGATSYCAVPAETGNKFMYFAMAARPKTTVVLSVLPFDRKYLAAVARAFPAMVSSAEPTN
jgi:hypothetical protein